MSLITYLTRVHFADGVLEEAVAAEVSALGIKRPLIVTDKGLVDCGLVERLLDAFPVGVEPQIFDETPSNPHEAACTAAAEMYTALQCDGLIGFGGGSSIDLAKATGLLASHGGELSAYAAIEGGTSRIRNKLPPLIAIPTTAGTGSEVGRASVMIVADGRKLGILSPYMIPTVAICDPTLTIELPQDLTAATGMDALTHCVGNLYFDRLQSAGRWYRDRRFEARVQQYRKSGEFRQRHQCKAGNDGRSHEWGAGLPERAWRGARDEPRVGRPAWLSITSR